MIRPHPVRLLCRITAAVAVVGILVATPATAGARGHGMADTLTRAVETASSTVLIKLAADATEPTAGPSQVAGLPGVEQVLYTIEGIDVHVAAVASGKADRVAAGLDPLPAVAYAEVNDAYELADAEEPNDPRLSDQYALDRIEAVAGWASYRTDRSYDEFPVTGSATIAVVDSGSTGATRSSPTRSRPAAAG